MFQQVDPFPERRAGDGEEALETVWPCRKMRLEPKENIDDERRVDLPLDCIGVVSEKTADLENLLDLLEEHFDVPAPFVERAHRARTPLEIVGDEDHCSPLAVNLDPGFYAAHLHPLPSAERDRNELIAYDVSFASGEIFDHMVFHVVLGPGHPENSPRRQIRQMPEIHVGLVEDDDFPRKKARAEFARPRVVVLPGGTDHEAGGKEAVQIESQVHLGRGFPPPVFRPVHAVGEELEHRGIHGMNAHFESAQHPSVSASRDEAGVGGLKFAEQPPEEFFGELGAAVPVCMGEGVAGRRGHSETGQGGLLELQPVANVVESHRMGQLRENHCAQVTPDAEFARLRVHTGLPCAFIDQPTGNMVEDLLKNRYVAAGWWCCFCFHTPAKWQKNRSTTSPNFPNIQRALWDGSVKECHLFQNR